MTDTLHVRAKSTGAGDDLYGSVAGAAAQSVRGEHGGPFKAAHQREATMETEAQIDELIEIEEQEADAPTCRSCGHAEGTNAFCEECTYAGEEA